MKTKGFRYDGEFMFLNYKKSQTHPKSTLSLSSGALALKHEHFLANFVIHVIYSNFFNVHTNVLEIKRYNSR